MVVMRLLLRNLSSLEFKALASLDISPANHCSDLGKHSYFSHNLSCSVCKNYFHNRKLKKKNTINATNLAVKLNPYWQHKNCNPSCCLPTTGGFSSAGGTAGAGDDPPGALWAGAVLGPWSGTAVIIQGSTTQFWAPVNNMWGEVVPLPCTCCYIFSFLKSEVQLIFRVV